MLHNLYQALSTIFIEPRKIPIHSVLVSINRLIIYEETHVYVIRKINLAGRIKREFKKA